MNMHQVTILVLNTEDLHLSGPETISIQVPSAGSLPQCVEPHPAWMRDHRKYEIIRTKVSHLTIDLH
jgi:hypothetical protein